MPLIKIEDIASDVKIGLWEIEPSVDDLLQSNPYLQSAYTGISTYRSESRKKEKLAIYALLYAMTGDADLPIGHNQDGKPTVNGYHISVSHTIGYAALILSKEKNVAVDIEYYSNRVNKVVHKFVREDEDKSSLDMLLVNWSAKESVYKFFSEQDLLYYEMQISHFPISTSGKIKVKNLKNPQSVDVYYRLNDSYVLTYTYG